MARMQVISTNPKFSGVHFLLPQELLSYDEKQLTFDDVDRCIFIQNQQALQHKAQEEAKVTDSCQEISAHNSVNSAKLQGEITSDNSTEDSADDEQGDMATSEKNVLTKIGHQSIAKRWKSIQKYKAKLAKRRALVPISKTFEGRKKAALAKNRVRGKFVRPEDQTEEELA